MADPPKPTAGMSLYADLLLAPDSKKPAAASTAVIASAPVRYNMKAPEPAAGDGKKKDAYQIPAYLRPQIQNMKGNRPVQQKPAASLASPSVTPTSAAATTAITTRSDPPAAKAPGLSQKSKFEDWVGRDDEEITYQRPKWHSQKKNKKRNNNNNNNNMNRREQTRIWSWDDVYDPSLPNSYADYKGSEEQLAEIRDWKARLYYHQLRQIDREAKQKKKKKQTSEEKPANKNPMFAPPSNLNFAPPTFDDQVATRRSSHSSSDAGDYYPPALGSDEQRAPPRQPVSFAASTSNDSTSVSRPVSFAPSTIEQPASAMSSSQSEAANTPPAPAQPTSNEQAIDANFQASAMAKAAAIKAKLNASLLAAKTPTAAVLPSSDSAGPSADPAQYTGPQDTQPPSSPPPPPPPPPAEQPRDTSSISRAPVRYQQPAQPAVDDPMPESEPPLSTSRPGQKNFAERYMQKFGYQKGKGLGAQGEGIVTPIIMKAEKRKKRSDAEGGGWAVSANMGKIVGGKKRKLDGDAEEPEVDMSPVVKIAGMVDGLDIDFEMQEKDLMQRIGDTLSQDHGNIERIFIWRKATGGDDAVFVKFNSAVSALGAVNRDGGIVFAGNTSKAVFFDADRFDKGELA